MHAILKIVEKPRTGGNDEALSEIMDLLDDRGLLHLVSLASEYEVAAEYHAKWGKLPESLSVATLRQIQIDDAIFKARVNTYKYAEAMKNINTGH